MTPSILALTSGGVLSSRLVWGVVGVRTKDEADDPSEVGEWSEAVRPDEGVLGDRLSPIYLRSPAVGM